ncbi:glycine cleavage system aminomethyltransferase GcvT [Martelella alba]|uniref:aminomethyltransferase n=1 Tax=Martelella alba TaxID=2590451 RepID=A0A506UIJ5_9HYPH|nr:glycine cleavage system aminomethyltransferase GcvT [Martelella alba]TPW33137.1 glycine cleavage system aminomethyltransferase GcvT [Martelella alba]
MNTPNTLKQTPLHALHLQLGARMVPFAGYDMPVQYPAGVLKEHLHTREKAGLFDVSHMGQVHVRPISGNLGDAAIALERLVPVDVAGLKSGRQRYAFFTNETGGILDDLMIANRGDYFYVVVNAACKHADLAHMKAALSDLCTVEEHFDDRALIALQGPRAEAVLMGVFDGAAAMKFMDVRDASIFGADCIISRSGYSGEDGFEISMPSEKAEEIARALLGHEDCGPVGLGARDSLRLEAGLCLYGNDIDTTTTPVEAALEWAMQKVRRNGGDREGGYPGASVILPQLASGASRRRVGLKAEGRAPIRPPAKLFADDQGAREVGHVTSGGFGPSVGAPVAMGYVETPLAVSGTVLYAEVRGKYLPVTVTDTPFVTATYKR